jgi:GDP-4-dehydro-6-deoxy-D-mannose reductase
MRAFITGISGFVGRHLAERLVSQGWEHVSGFDSQASDLPVPVHPGDLCDRAAISEALTASQPEVVFHLAGTIKAELAKDYFLTNVLGTLGLFEALLETGYRPRVMIASTSAVYGPGLGQRPISEYFPLHPMTDYAASKASQEMVSHRFYLGDQIPIVIVRTFNLLGPGQSPKLACSAFARQIALDENREDPEPIHTGNLSSKRDFVDVRDAVRAYELLAQEGSPGAVYNVCSGQAVSLQNCLNLLLGMATKPLITELEAARIQIHDLPIQVGSAKLIQRTVGWQPQISLQDSLADLLNDWRERVKTIQE